MKCLNFLFQIFELLLNNNLLEKYINKTKYITNGIE